MNLELREQGVEVLSSAGPRSASKGLRMGIIRSFVAEIGGEVKFGRGDGNQGARFTVLFSLPRQVGLTAEFGGGRGQ